MLQMQLKFIIPLIFLLALSCNCSEKGGQARIIGGTKANSCKHFFLLPIKYFENIINSNFSVLAEWKFMVAVFYPEKG